MFNLKERLQELKLQLPEAPAPAANYVPFVKTGNLLFISGQISSNENGLIKGVLGKDMDVDAGYEAASRCCLSLIAHLNNALDGDFSKFKRAVRLAGFINSISDFDNHPTVLNGASDLMVKIFGEKGKHMRVAVGATLPLGVAVEVEGLFEVY
ncbi:MAG: hypothetical protein CML37_02650 [Rhodobacteraceae bacterium]|nr:hypothetical protein [Paracoccaceae bacterium]|tara:strand:- start:984 stop:1442 length:459 start_codon:yes stop_codon:yes gene_type:complete